jgi:hypothetical protein
MLGSFVIYIHHQIYYRDEIMKVDIGNITRTGVLKDVYKILSEYTEEWRC